MLKLDIMRNKRGSIAIALFFLAAAFIIGGGLILSSIKPKQSTNLGASFTPVQTGKTTLSGAGITASATTTNLTSLLYNDGVTPVLMSNFGSIGFATIEPGVPKKEENISFTGITQNSNGTAVLTGVTRGLTPFSPYTASTTLAIAHSGGSTLIISNSGAFYNQFAIANNTTTINANWTFSSGTIPVFSGTPNFTSNLQIVDKAYVDQVATSGAADAGYGAKGLVALQQFWSSISTPTSSDGSTFFYNVPNFGMFATSSTGTGNVGVVTASTTGKLDKSFIDQSLNYSWTGSNSYGSSTFTATTTFQSSAVFSLPLSGVWNYQVFTASTTWTVPTGTTKLWITLVGGGGGGGTNASSSNCPGGGGGSGGVLLNIATTTTPGATITVTVGSGGKGGVYGTTNASGTAGVASSVGEMSAGGGGGGGAGASSQGTAGSAGSPHGDAGAVGGTCGGSQTAGSGAGGWFGVGGAGSFNGATSTKSTTGYGAGGGGTESSGQNSAAAGEDGVVIIQY